MKVKVIKSWFTPDNRLLKAGIHDVPDDWLLPSSVEVIEEPELPKKPAVK
jgi:hypothetical protein